MVSFCCKVVAPLKARGSPFGSHEIWDVPRSPNGYPKLPAHHSKEFYILILLPFPINKAIAPEERGEIRTVILPKFIKNHLPKAHYSQNLS